MKKWSKQIDTYTETQFGLSADQLLGSLVLTGVLLSLLNVIQVAGQNLLSF
jgi:hypothetical protein